MTGSYRSTDHRGVRRILDANANRAREALRVIDDAGRFLLNHAGVTRDAKSLRHDLVDALRAFGDLTDSRDVVGDVGTTITTDAERHRASNHDVVRAACGRLTESLRAIEEFGKRLDADAAHRIERIRYRAYDLERRCLRHLNPRSPRGWRLCVLLTEAQCTHHDWMTVAMLSLDAGVDMLQLREPDLDDRELLARARALVEHNDGRATIIINNRPDIALLAGADGVHLGQRDLSAMDARMVVGHDRLIGVSTSCLHDARRAAADDADYVGLGPMFPSSTKPKDAIEGPAYLRAYLEDATLPHLAISGITPENLHALIDAGVRGIAVSSAVCGASDPAGVIATFHEMLPIHDHDP